MKNVIFVISLFLLSSCINENTSHIPFPEQLLHGNSAKVWVLSKTSNPNDPHFSALENYRKSFIFYSNNTFREQELIHLGSKKGRKGKYQIGKVEKGTFAILLTYSDNKMLPLNIESISNSKLKVKRLLDDPTIWEFNSLKPPRL